ALPEPSVAEALKWIKPNESVDLLFIDGEPSDVQLGASVELEVTHTEPGVRGDTASGGGSKPATLETGATVNVPLFVNIGDGVRVAAGWGSYMWRAWVGAAACGRLRPLPPRPDRPAAGRPVRGGRAAVHPRARPRDRRSRRGPRRADRAPRAQLDGRSHR